MLLCPVMQLTASESKQGLDIQADSADTNLQTAVSRLQGNVILKHGEFNVTGDSAEIQSANEKNPQIYVVRGTPATFKQQSKTSSMTANSKQIEYRPVEELMELQEMVSLVQSDDKNKFTFIADELQIILVQQRPQHITTKGNPTVFTHEQSEKNVQIEAKKITWDTQSQIANMFQATVKEGKTTFSAEKITYNAVTGKISATGDGKTRPSYRFEPDKVKEKNNNNDT